MANKKLADVVAAIRERVARADMSEKGKATLEAALAAINEIKGEMDEAASAKIVEALSSALSGATVMQSAIGRSAELPPDVRAEFERVQRSADEANKRAEKLERSIAERDRLDRRAERIARAASEFEHIPGSADEVGGLIADVAEHDAKLAEKLEGVFRSADAIISKSEVFVERGSSLTPAKSGTATAKVDALVKESVQRSATEGKPLTTQQALRTVLMTDRNLARAYAAEQRG